jgi:hypothetical protein
MSRRVAPARPVSLSVGKAAARPAYRGASFFITVNTNIVPRTDADANRIGQDLSNAINKTFTDDASFRRLITFRNGAARNFDDIKDTKVDFRVELGPATGKLHAHILVETTHTVRDGIHINVSGLRRGLLSNTNEPENRRLPYINVRGFRNRATLLAYISKSDDPAVVAFADAV